MSPAERRREERWLRRGIATLVVLAVALLAVTVYGVTRDVSSRQAAADRASRILVELERVATELDAQADQLADAASETDESRAQFRAAISRILVELGVAADDVFPERQPEPAPSSQDDPDPGPSESPQPSPSPSPTPGPTPTPDPTPSPSPLLCIGPVCVDPPGLPSPPGAS